jgi:ankyrin repeat protein
MQGDLGVVLALLEAGCTPSDKQLGNLLRQAIMSNNLSIFDALLSNRELPASELTRCWTEIKHPLGKSMLHIACREASTKLVASMVEHYGWDKNALDSQKHTPLQYALRGHCFDTMTLAYLVMVARVDLKCLSSEHVHALMKRVSPAMAKPVGGISVHAIGLQCCK